MRRFCWCWVLTAALLVHLTAALVCAQEEGTDLFEEAKKLSYSQSKQDRDLAIAKYLKAIEIFEKTKNHEGVYRAANDLGALYGEAGNLLKAEEMFQKAWEALKQAKGLESEKEVKLLHNLGLLLTNLARYKEAEEKLARALTLAREIEDVSLERSALISTASLLYETFEYEKAVDFYRKARDLAKKGSSDEARILIQLGMVYISIGEYHMAEESLLNAMGICRRLDNDFCNRAVFTNLACLHESVGRIGRAMDYFKLALELARKTGSEEATDLYNLARLHEHQSLRMAEFPEKSREHSGIALDHFMRSLRIYEQLGDTVHAELTKKLLGYHYLNQCGMDPEKCQLDQAEQFVKEAGFPDGLAALCLVTRDYKGAIAQYEQALGPNLKANDSDGIFTCCTGLGVAYEKLGDYARAAEYYRQAVDHLEKLRFSLTTAERQGFFDYWVAGYWRTEPYEGLARVLMKSGSKQDALKASEFTKARLFSEVLSRKSESGSFNIPQDVLAADTTLNEKLARLRKKWDKAHRVGNKHLLEEVEPRIRAAEKDLFDHIAALRRQYPQFAQTKYPQPMDLQGMALTDHEWVLSFDVTDSGTLLYLTKGTALVHAVLEPISRKELQELVARYRKPLEITHSGEAFTKLESFDVGASRKLADLLLGDVLQFIPKGAPLIIVPDDCLAVAPFETLLLADGAVIDVDKSALSFPQNLPRVKGGEFLADRNPIGYSQSVTALHIMRSLAAQAHPNGKMLTIVDHLEPDMLEEGKRLKEMLPYQVDLCEGLPDLNWLRTPEGCLLGYRHITFLTHAVGKIPEQPDSELCRQETPTEPYIRVSRADRNAGNCRMPLTMSEVMGLKMNANIVSLMSCESGLGSRLPGEGVMSLGRAFQYSGARAVLASLWSTEMKSTTCFVMNFFRLLQEGNTKLEAMRLARNAVRDAGYQHPWFWASYILIGSVD